MSLEGVSHLEDYFRLDIRALERRLDDPAAPPWEDQGRAHALRTFREAARRVPAYRDFLARHGVDPIAIRTAADFAAVPPTDKTNYIERYPLEALAWDGKPT
ncbi:MAG TPA: hypothetical protein VF590_15445, partial [Isosphaeraceae bacterium]